VPITTFDHERPNLRSDRSYNDSYNQPEYRRLKQLLAVAIHKFSPLTLNLEPIPSFILPRDALIVTHNPYGWRLGDWSQWVGAKNDGVV
jgi:hypothetical protein